MTKQDFQTTLDAIVKQVFGPNAPQITLDQAEEWFTQGIELPKEVSCNITGKTLWTAEKGEKFISLEAVMDRVKEDDFMMPQRNFKNVEEILSAWKEINYILASKEINSKDVLASDEIYNSSNVYKSHDIMDSKHVLLSSYNQQCEYVVAASKSAQCQFDIRVLSSKVCTNSFDVSFSYKVRNSMFIHDSADLSDCLFCAHIRSKRFCIANTQLAEGEYKRLKEIILQELFQRGFNI